MRPNHLDHSTGVLNRNEECLFWGKDDGGIKGEFKGVELLESNLNTNLQGMVSSFQ